MILLLSAALLLILLLTLSSTPSQPLPCSPSNKQTKVVPIQPIRSFDSCAKQCKTTADCYGFVYDRNTGDCFLSDSPVQRNEVELGGGISSNLDVCNNPVPVQLASQFVPFHERRSNAMFVCNGDDRLQPEYYLHNQNKMIRIDEGQNLDWIPNIDVYNVYN